MTTTTNPLLAARNQLKPIVQEPAPTPKSTPLAPLVNLVPTERQPPDDMEKFLQHYVTQAKSNHNHLEVTFLIRNIARFRIYNRTTKEYSYIAQNPLLDPSILDDAQEFTGFVIFKFKILSENKNNLVSLQPDDRGEFTGCSGILPFLGPYIKYKTKMIALPPKTAESLVKPKKTNGKSKYQYVDSIMYKMVEILDYQKYTNQE